MIVGVPFKETFRVNTFKEFLFSLVFVINLCDQHGHVLALKLIIMPEHGVCLGLGDLRWYLDSVHADRFKIR